MTAPIRTRRGSFEQSLIGGKRGKGFRDITGTVWCGHTALRFVHQQLWMFRCQQGHEFRVDRSHLELKHKAGKPHQCPECREHGHD